MTEFLQVQTAAGNRDEAERLAAGLIDRRLAACVQIVGPVHSRFRWQGAIDAAEEWLCLIKTTRGQYRAVEDAIRAIHSYECPEIVALPIEAGSAMYLRWLADETREPPKT
jgi:periplasmic divalent cation tolerance protein